MGRGKATGLSLEYQRICKRFVEHTVGKHGLVPLDGDGIDVKIHLGGDVYFTVDVALRDPESKLLLLMECKRKEKRGFDQGQVAAFAMVIHDLRQGGTDVEGIMVCLNAAQVGAKKAARRWNIRLTECPHSNSPALTGVIDNVVAGRTAFMAASLEGRSTLSATLSAVHPDGSIR